MLRIELASALRPHERIGENRSRSGRGEKLLVEIKRHFEIPIGKRANDKDNHEFKNEEFQKLLHICIVTYLAGSDPSPLIPPSRIVCHNRYFAVSNLTSNNNHNIIDIGLKKF